MSQWRLPVCSGLELLHFGQFQRQAVFGNHSWHPVLVIYGEWLAPISLAAEYGVAQTVIHFYLAQIVFAHVFFRSCYRVLYAETVQYQVAILFRSCFRGVAYNTLFCVKTFFAHVATLYQRHYRQVEVLGKSIVAAVVCRNGHYRARTVTCQNIVANPNRNFVSRKRIDCIAARENTRNATVAYAFAFGTFGRPFQIGFDLRFLRFCGQLQNEFAFGGKHHESYAEHRVGPCGEYGELKVAVFYLEPDFRTFRTSDPVALGFFKRIGPLQSVQTVQQPLGVGRYAQAPLAHFFLHHRETSAFAYSVHDLVVCQYRAQAGTPVHHGFAQICYAVVHQHFFLALLIHGVPFGSGESHYFGTCRI